MGLISNDMLIEDDLQIENNDIKIGEADIYNIDYLLKLYPGQIRHYPKLGIGIQDEINSSQLKDETNINNKYINNRNTKIKIKTGLKLDGYISDIQIYDTKFYINNSKQENKLINIKIDEIIYQKTGKSKIVTVIEGQTILDICLQEYGTLEYLTILMSDNNLNYDDDLTGGQQITIYSDDRGYAPFKEYIELNEFKVIN